MRSKPGRQRQVGRVALEDGDAVEVEPARLGGDLGGAVLVELDRDHLAAVLHPRRDLAGLDPRAGAEVEHRLPRPRVEHLDHRGRAAALRGQRALADERRHRVPEPPGEDHRLRHVERPARRRPGETSTPSPRSRATRSARASASAARIATSAGSLQAASSARAASAPSSSHHIRASQSGAEWATAAASGVESSPSSASVSDSRSRAARRRIALTKPDAWARLGDLDQLDRLVDGGVVGGPVGEEQLVEAEAQRRGDRRVEQPDRPTGELLDRRVGGAFAAGPSRR